MKIALSVMETIAKLKFPNVNVLIIIMNFQVIRIVDNVQKFIAKVVIQMLQVNVYLAIKMNNSEMVPLVVFVR